METAQLVQIIHGSNIHVLNTDPTQLCCCMDIGADYQQIFTLNLINDSNNNDNTNMDKVTLAK